MNAPKKHLTRERNTMEKMVGIFCADHHGPKGAALCSSCQAFFDYAERRLEKCPYGDDKPTWANCPIHCYKPMQRAQAREIMRYAGPRMLLHHPLLTIAHLLDGFRKALHPRKLTREQRIQSRKD